MGHKIILHFLFLLPIHLFAMQCMPLEKICEIKGETRIVEGVSVTLPCWQYRYQQKCTFDVDTTCTNLRKEGCTELSSTCRETYHDRCVVQTETLNCPVKTCQLTDNIVCGKPTFCMEGECTDHPQVQSQDFGESVSRLAAVAETGKDVQNQNVHEGQSIHVFSGHAMECSDILLGAKNCCQDKGWGIDIGLASCTDQEKKLGEARQKELAIYAGRYCHNRVLGECVSHHQVYCVFDSKIASIIQAQGRHDQLGIPFGHVQDDDNSVDCRGLTPDEITRLNFKAMNFSSLIDGIKANVRQPNNEDIERAVQEKAQSLYEKRKPHE